MPKHDEGRTDASGSSDQENKAEKHPAEQTDTNGTTSAADGQTPKIGVSKINESGKGSGDR